MIAFRRILGILDQLIARNCVSFSLVYTDIGVLHQPHQEGIEQRSLLVRAKSILGTNLERSVEIHVGRCDLLEADHVLGFVGISGYRPYHATNLIDLEGIFDHYYTRGEDTAVDLEIERLRSRNRIHLVV